MPIPNIVIKLFSVQKAKPLLMYMIEFSLQYSAVKIQVRILITL